MQGIYANVLADLRYATAVSAIRAICETPDITGDWLRNKLATAPGAWLPEVAWIRLTRSWGQPVNGLRLLLLAPDAARAGEPVLLAGLMENVGDNELEVVMTPGVWTLDGRRDAFHDMTPIDGNPILDVNTVAMREARAPALGPGRHEIQFTLFGASSNRLTVDTGEGPR